MGMDLEPVKPSTDAPRWPDDDKYEPGAVIWGRYNWSGWAELQEQLTKWGIAAIGLSDHNDGEVIPAATCVAIGEAIEQHIEEFEPERREYQLRKAKCWKTCGGYYQF